MNKKEQIINSLRIWFTKTNIITYDKEIGLRWREKELRKLRNGSEKEVYIVSFKTESDIEYNEQGEIIDLLEGMYCFAYFDAETLELLYIHKKIGYIEVDGSY